MYKSAPFSSLFSLFICAVLFLGCSTTKTTTSSSSGDKTNESKTDSELKPYDEVITDEATTDDGLFNVHTLNEKLYYEIPTRCWAGKFYW